MIRLRGPAITELSAQYMSICVYMVLVLLFQASTPLLSGRNKKNSPPACPGWGPDSDFQVQFNRRLIERHSKRRIGDETMTRTILLTAAAVALTTAVSTTNASAAAPAAKSGQISTDLLAQFGLGGSQEVSDTEGEQIRGKGGRANLQNRYRRAINRKIVRNNTVRLTRVRNGSRVAPIARPGHSTKRTTSRSGSHAGANRFRF